jgi:hypothetical protein
MKEKEKKDRKPYEKPAVVFEKELEALAVFCGEGIGDVFLGGNNCKGPTACAVVFS